MGDPRDRWPHNISPGALAEYQARQALEDERRKAEAEMAYSFANTHMPADIRSRARAWGMGAFCEVLWNNAFQAGYREAMRCRGETQTEADNG